MIAAAWRRFAVTSTRRRLREVIEAPGISVAPGVTNVFCARLAQAAGFDLVFTTGAGIANTWLGLPDLGLTSMSEVLSVTRHIVEGIDLPVIADVDTGYGNHMNVMRTVREFEAAGVAGLYIEDQVAPKRCGHFEGKQVIPVTEMVEKLVAATMARRDPDLVLVARTDAIAVEGLEAALSRATAYVEAGADVIFVEAPRNLEELAAIPPAVSAPCLVNMVEGGKTPLVSATELEAMGYRLAIYANLALRMAARAVEKGFRVLRQEGSSRSLLDEMFSWDERQLTVGLDDWMKLDARIGAAAHRLVSPPPVRES